jgi:hypothetical protein
MRTVGFLLYSTSATSVKCRDLLVRRVFPSNLGRAPMHSLGPELP